MGLARLTSLVGCGILAIRGHALVFLLKLPNLQQLLRLAADLLRDHALCEAVVQGCRRTSHPAAKEGTALQRREGNV